MHIHKGNIALPLVILLLAVASIVAFLFFEKSRTVQLENKTPINFENLVPASSSAKNTFEFLWAKVYFEGSFVKAADLNLGAYPGNGVPKNFNYVEGITFEAVEKGTHVPIVELAKPLKIEISYGDDTTQKRIKDCAWKDDQFKMYYFNTELKDFVALPTKVDKINMKASSIVDSLDKSGSTEFVLSAPQNRYLLGCGPQAEAVIDGNVVSIFPAGIKFNINEKLGRPGVGMYGGRYVAFDNFAKGSFKNLELSMNNYQVADSTLPPNLDEIKVYKCIEMCDPSPVVDPSEKLIKRQEEDINGNKVISVESSDEKNKFFRVFVKNPNSVVQEGANWSSINIVELKGPVSDDGWEEAKQLVLGLERSIFFSIPKS